MLHVLMCATRTHVCYTYACVLHVLMCATRTHVCYTYACVLRVRAKVFTAVSIIKLRCSKFTYNTVSVDVRVNATKTTADLVEHNITVGIEGLDTFKPGIPYNGKVIFYVAPIILVIHAVFIMINTLQAENISLEKRAKIS